MLLLFPLSLRMEWFKLFLDPNVLRDGRASSSARLPDLPFGKQPIDVVVDFLTHLWRYAKRKITEEIGSVADLGGLRGWSSGGASLTLLLVFRGC